VDDSPRSDSRPPEPPARKRRRRHAKSDDSESVLLLPFKISEDQAEHHFRQWVLYRALATKDFRAQAHITSAEPVFVPYWAGRLHLTAEYTGQRTVRARKTSPGGETSWGEETEQVEGTTPLKSLKLATPAFSPDAYYGEDASAWFKRIRSGWKFDRVVRQGAGQWKDHEFLKPTVTVDTAVADAAAKYRHDHEVAIKNTIEDKIGGVSRSVPHFELAHKSDLALAYAPVWIVEWAAGNEHGVAVVNGHNGKTAGESVTSGRKVAVAAGAGAVLVAAACFGLDSCEPPQDSPAGASDAATETAAPATEEVTRQEYELQDKDWPFEADSAVLACEAGETPTVSIGGQTYHLAPVTDEDLDQATAEGWKDVDAIAVEADFFAGPFLHDVVADATALCR
jgi:hypothetical protein